MTSECVTDTIHNATSLSAKRKLSVSSTTSASVTSPSSKQISKKPKLSDRGDNHELELPEGSEGAEVNTEESKQATSIDKPVEGQKLVQSSPDSTAETAELNFAVHCEQSKRLEGDGPFNFLISSESLADIDDNPIPILFTREVERMYTKLSILPEDERMDACDIETVPICIADVEKLDAEPGTRLKEMWEGLEVEWCEATFQKERPPESQPALEFNLESDEEASWWMTNIASPSETVLKAIALVSEHMSTGLDGF